MLVRKHYIFKGRVQGVGFRFTTYQKATALNLTGWVRNLYDDSVEACFQGEETKIQQLIKEMQNIRFIIIDNMEVEDLTIQPSEHSFEIKY